MGTDSGVTPHGQNLRELAFMCDLGMDPTDVLVSATGTASELMGLKAEIGTLEVGRRADAVVFDGAVIETGVLDLSDLRPHVELVIQDGQVVNTQDATE